MRYAISILVSLSGAIAGCAAPARCPSTTAPTTSATVHAAPAAPPVGSAASTPKVTGIGGIFFKAKDSKALTAWYVKNLGFPQQAYGSKFEWHQKDAPTQPGSTTWATFPESTKFFDPTTARFMLNYRVNDLDGMLARLREAGAKVDDKIEVDDNGRFAGAIDPEGNRFQLWEPAPGK
jgi:predicted enzyme related to lactoylglutathione lyase